MGEARPAPGGDESAHLGVLFLDELRSSERGVLGDAAPADGAGDGEDLRVRYALTFPARFQLVAAMNP